MSTSSDDITTEAKEKVDAASLLKFIQKYGLSKSVTTLEETQQAVKDFDGNQDGTLSYDEFCTMLLPATNSHIRDMAV